MNTTDPIQIDAGERIGDLLDALCDARSSAIVKAPSGRLLYVCPVEDFELLHAVFNDRQFVESLEVGAAEFTAGAGRARRAADRPAMEPRRVLRDPGFVESIERAASDFAAAAGCVRTAGERPQIA